MAEPAGRSQPPSPEPLSGESFVVDEQFVRRLMQRLEETRENEYSCEETFALLDEYVELANSREEAAVLMPLVQHHIDACPDCRERFEVLLRILQTETSSS
jgi:hypothetical protein